MASFGKWLKDSIASTLGFSSGAHGKAVLLGLDAAGKTTFLYRAKSRSTEVDTFIPTIGFNVETVVVARTDVTCWDVGGCDKIRPLWQHYFRDAQVLVYFVDSNDIDRMEEARNELKYFLDMSEKKLPLLVVANKQDLPRALNTWEVIRTLELDKIQDRVWNIMGMIATNGTGVSEAVQWISAAAKGQAPPLQCTAEDIDGRGGVFERIEQSEGPGPLQSIEGWIVIVTGVHQEASEEDVMDKFLEYGDVKNIHVNLDRRTGFVKGYALIEYERFEDARKAIRAMNGKELLGRTVHVDWAFVKK